MELLAQQVGVLKQLLSRLPAQAVP